MQVNIVWINLIYDWKYCNNLFPVATNVNEIIFTTPSKGKPTLIVEGMKKVPRNSSTIYNRN